MLTWKSQLPLSPFSPWQRSSQLLYLKPGTTHSVAGHSVRDSAPRRVPSVFALLLSPCLCPLANEWTFNDLRGPFNWVENVQVCGALLHLSYRKQRAPLTHTHSREGWSGFTHWLERRLNTHIALVVFTRFSTDPLRTNQVQWIMCS